MKIGLVASVKPSHPYLENDPVPLFDLHYLRISPWLWFRNGAGNPDSPQAVIFLTSITDVMMRS